ncbi:MAG: ABC transporter ATP-binding protein, partial [Patescibacteria group bacterium]
CLSFFRDWGNINVMRKTFGTFYGYLFRHPALFLGGMVTLVIARSAENMQNFFVKWIVQAVTTNDYETAIRLVLWMGTVLLFGTFFHIISQMLGDRSAMRTLVDVNLDALKKIHELDFSYHAEKSSGRLISLTKRGEDAMFNLTEIINRELFGTLIGFGFLLYAFWGTDPKYVAITLFVLTLSAITMRPLIKYNMGKRKELTQWDDRISGMRIDNFINFDTVKYFAKEEFEQGRFLKALRSWDSAAQEYFNTFRLFDLTIGNYANLAITATILVAVWDLTSGRIDLASFVLISSFSVTVFPRLIAVLMNIRSIAKRYTDLQDLFKIFEEKSTVADAAAPLTIDSLRGEIVIDDVSFAYHSRARVFRNLSLNIRPGESVALVGLSGSGKTTLVKLLMRMYDTTLGEIRVDGVDVKNMKKSYLRSLIGIVPQDPIMFNNTIGYNIKYGKPEASEEEVWEALRASMLERFVRSLPDGLETKVGERGIKLSGGQRQRLAIARVLLEKAKIIIFDEATSSLDSESEGAIQDAFWNLAKDPTNPRTSIVIAHRLSTVMRTDRIIVLKRGTIAESGTHKKLIKQPGGLYKKLWEMQQNGFLAE